jgi:hypothetical protein
MKRKILCALVLSGLLGGYVVAQFPNKRDTTRLPDVTAVQPQYQVVDSETSSRLATQEEATKDIKERLAVIDQSIKEIRADIKTLMETNIIVHFLAQSFTILVPGLIIAAFSVWFAKRPKKRPPTRVKAASL